MTHCLSPRFSASPSMSSEPDDEYVYLLVLPSDVQWLENDPVSKAQYEQLCADSQEVLERFLNDSGSC